MKAIIFQEMGKYEYKINYPKPEPGEQDVVVEVEQCGLCGTDVHIYEGEFGANFPVIIGHEFSGTVKEVGDDVEKFSLGDRVAVNPNTVCNRCEFCRGGQENLCITLPGLGVNSDGGFAEYASVPERCIYHIPDKLSFSAAAFTEPLSCAIHGTDLANIDSGDDVLILGSGPTGLLLMQLAKISGAGRVISTAKRDKRLEVARQLGATSTINITQEDLIDSVKEISDSKGMDIVIEAVGSEATMKRSVELARPGGRIVWFGVTSPDLEVPIKPFEVYRKELTIRGSFVNPYTTERAIDLLVEGNINTDELVTHRFGLDQFEEAMDAYMYDDSRIKILLEP